MYGAVSGAHGKHTKHSALCYGTLGGCELSLEQEAGLGFVMCVCSKRERQSERDRVRVR